MDNERELLEKYYVAESYSIPAAIEKEKEINEKLLEEFSNVTKVEEAARIVKEIYNSRARLERLKSRMEVYSSVATKLFN